MSEQRLIDANAFDNRVRVAGGFAEEELSDDFKDGVLAVLEMLKRQPTIEERKTGTWTTEEVAELLFNMFGEECACNFNGIDEWLPERCKYAETTCPEPKEKHGCWMQFLLQGGADMRGEDDDL